MADEPVTFSDLGIKTEKSVTETCLGKVRSINTLTKVEVFFLVVSILCLLSGIVIALVRLGTDIQSTSTDFTFALVLIINAVFCLSYVFSGVFFERASDIAILVLATGVVWLYLVLNYAVGIKDVNKMVRLIIASVLSPIIIVIGGIIGKNYYESNNLIFRTVGAQQQLQEMCNTMFVWISLQKADLQVAWSLAILILTSGKDLDVEDKVVLPLAAIISLVSAVIGYLAVRLENIKLMIAYTCLWITIPAYAIYLIVMSVDGLDNTESSKSIIAVRFLAAAIAIVVRATILFYGIKVYLNFGKGLKERAYGNTGAGQATFRDQRVIG